MEDKELENIESREVTPSPQLLEKLLRALDMKPEDVPGLQDAQSPEELKTEIAEMLKKLNDEELGLIFYYMKNFLIK